jgi:hypothetical protein
VLLGVQNWLFCGGIGDVDGVVDIVIVEVADIFADRVGVVDRVVDGVGVSEPPLDVLAFERGTKGEMETGISVTLKLTEDELETGNSVLLNVIEDELDAGI